MPVSHPLSTYPLLYQQHLRFSLGLFSLLHSRSLDNPPPHILDIRVTSASSLPLQGEQCIWPPYSKARSYLPFLAWLHISLFLRLMQHTTSSSPALYLCTRISFPNSQTIFSLYSAKLFATDFTKVSPMIFKYSHFSSYVAAFEIHHNLILLALKLRIDTSLRIHFSIIFSTYCFVPSTLIPSIFQWCKRF